MIHFSNNFISSKVHSELVKQIAVSDEPQSVLVPIRTEDHQGLNDPQLDGVNVYYFRYPNLLRFFPLVKLVVIFLKSISIFRKSLRDRSDNVKCVAHNFWSDGVPLFLLSLFFNVRYFLVVRNTDINIFVPKLIHYRWLMKLVIKRSGGMVFVSEAHKVRFEKKWPKLLKVARRVEVIPNGVNDFWHLNKVDCTLQRPVSACFIGNFNANKNVARLIEAAKSVQSDFPEFRLILVGGSKSELSYLLGGSAVPDFVDVKGRVTSKEELAQLLRAARVFLMPSLRETFGLVFIEAMSQGCALICSKGEGIDGMFGRPYVRSVSATDTSEIAAVLKEMLEEFGAGCPVDWVEEQLEKFKWDNVARRYQAFL